MWASGDDGAASTGGAGAAAGAGGGTGLGGGIFDAGVFEAGAFDVFDDFGGVRQSVRSASQTMATAATSRTTIASRWPRPSSNGLSASTAAATRSRTRCSAPTEPGPRAERTVAAEREQQQDRAEGDQDRGVLAGARTLDQQEPTEEELHQLVDPERDPAGGRVVVGAGHRPSLRAAPGATGSLRAVTGGVTGGATPAWARHLPPGVDPGSVDLLAQRSLPAAWVANWAAAPARAAVHDDRGWLTNAELDSRSRRIAGRLAGAGLRSGDRIVMSATTSVELVVAHVAALRLGLVVVPVNGAYRAREIEHIVGDCAPAGVRGRRRPHRPVRGDRRRGRAS